MKACTVFAWAKLNLTLNILGLRTDGYHALDMLMQAISLRDEVCIVQGTGTPWQLSCTEPEIPQDERNLAWRAASIFFRYTGLSDGGLTLRITKHIPSQAGLAGGSADAAAVLRGLNAQNGNPLSKEELLALAVQIGSDVPFCVLGGTARAKGRGEVLQPISLTTRQHYVICKPPFGISTPKLFTLSDQHPSSLRPNPEALLACLQKDDVPGAGGLLCNVLEPVAALEHPEILRIKDALLASGAYGAQMTGSGSAVFGLFPGEAEAKKAVKTLKSRDFATFYAHSV